MKIILKSQDFTITPSVRDYILKRIEPLGKFLKFFKQEIILAEVEVGRSTRHHRSGDVFRAEVNISVGSKVFRAEAVRDDLLAAVDEVREELEQSIKKFKNKKATIFIRGARSIAKKFRVSPLARFKK